jgi:hypothetical protein
MFIKKKYLHIAPVRCAIIRDNVVHTFLDISIVRVITGPLEELAKTPLEFTVFVRD